MSCVRLQVSHVLCQMSGVRCHMSHVTCANSPIIHSRLVCKTKNLKKCKSPKNHCNGKNPKMSRGMPILAIRSSTRSLQSTGKRSFADGTHDSWTSQLRDWIDPVGIFSENYFNKTGLNPWVCTAMYVCRQWYSPPWFLVPPVLIRLAESFFSSFMTTFFFLFWGKSCNRADLGEGRETC